MSPGCPLGAHQLEDGVLGAVALPGHDAGAAHQPRRQVVHDVPVQVGHHQDVELVGILHQLGLMGLMGLMGFWGLECLGEAPGTALVWWGWVSSEVSESFRAWHNGLERK